MFIFCIYVEEFPLVSVIFNAFPLGTEQQNEFWNIYCFLRFFVHQDSILEFKHTNCRFFTPILTENCLKLVKQYKFSKILKKVKNELLFAFDGTDLAIFPKTLFLEIFEAILRKKGSKKKEIMINR